VPDVIGGETVEAVYLCPECGSPSVDYPEAFGTVAECQACGWVGKQAQMLVTPLVHLEGSKENIVARLTGDIRMIIVKHFAVPFGRFLMQWGFVTQENLSKEVMGRYIAAATLAVLKATIITRQEMEKERVRGN